MMVTRKEVAEYAKVSTGTVSNILNGKKNVDPKLVSKVNEAINVLGYVPNHNAKSLASKSSKHIGIAIYEYENSYHWNIVRGIEEVAMKAGYLVSVFVLDNNSNFKLESICERRLAALINLMTNEYPKSFIDILEKQNVKLINFDGRLGPLFTLDYSDAMKEIFKKLVDDGHKKIAYVWTSDEQRFNADTRGQTYKSEIKKYGLDSENLVYYNYDGNKMSYDIGYDGCKEIMSKNKDIDAIFCTNDLTAIGTIRALKDCGYRVPEDVCVVGCDDTFIAKDFVPSITSITFDQKAQGMSMANVIINEWNPEYSQVIKPTAVFRESTGTKK